MSSFFNQETGFKQCLGQDPDPLDPQDFGFLDQDPQKYPNPRGKISTKNCKKYSLFLNGSTSFKIKICKKKNKIKNLKIIFCKKKFSKFKKK